MEEVNNSTVIIQWGVQGISYLGDYTIYYPIAYSEYCINVVGNTGWWKTVVNPYQFYTTYFIANLSDNHGNTGVAGYMWISLGY